MKKVMLKELSVSSIGEFLVVVKDALTECKETQIFISEELFRRLLEEIKSSIIWEEDVFGSFHYCDKVEHAFIFCLNGSNGSKTCQMHFVRDSTDYVHLTYFASKGMMYQHYLKGMKIILIISSDQ